MSHADAARTPRQRLRLAQKIVNEEWNIAAAADRATPGEEECALWESASGSARCWPARDGVLDRLCRAEALPIESTLPHPCEDGEPARRSRIETPGALIHVDVKNSAKPRRRRLALRLTVPGDRDRARHGQAHRQAGRCRQCDHRRCIRAHLHRRSLPCRLCRVVLLLKGNLNIHPAPPAYLGDAIPVTAGFGNKEKG